MQNANATSNSSNYYNLHTRGVGYLGRVRKVTVRKGAPFWSAMINALSGEKGVEGGVQYTPFDVKAVGKDTEALMEQFQAVAADDTKRVLVQFTIGDATIHSFTYQQGPRQGQAGTTMKGRLLKIQRVWVKDLTKNEGDEAGNKLVYVDPSVEQASADAKRTGTEG
jgi:hypothetical protein